MSSKTSHRPHTEKMLVKKKPKIAVSSKAMFRENVLQQVVVRVICFKVYNHSH